MRCFLGIDKRVSQSGCKMTKIDSDFQGPKISWPMSELNESSLLFLSGDVKIPLVGLF